MKKPAMKSFALTVAGLKFNGQTELWMEEWRYEKLKTLLIYRLTSTSRT
jgi:hypothetical protein